eukprot:4094821-Ditylum_brightwellii.AAC.1
MSNRDYFRAWDNFDVDEAEQALDETEELSKSRASDMKTWEDKKNHRRHKHRAQELSKLRD